jgi:hypothetical protein
MAVASSYRPVVSQALIDAMAATAITNNGATRNSYSKMLSNGNSATVLASEHNLNTVSGIKLYDTNGKEVLVDYSINTGRTITINSEINLLNYILKIFN